MLDYLAALLVVAVQEPIDLILPEPVTITQVAAPPIYYPIAPAAPPPPPPLPTSVRETIEAAIASGDEKAVAAVVRFAKMANPRGAADIDAMEKAFRTDLDEKRQRQLREERERLAAASALEYWDGQAEIGASRSTGNTRNLGIYGALNGTREGLQWRHRFTARAELQETNDVRTTERVLLSWQPNYKFDDRLYAFGLAQYEHDRSLGYSNRYTAGGGVGYGIIARTNVKLDFEGGPAFRYTDPIDGNSGATVAGRASFNLKWKISPTLELTQNSALYYEPGDTSANASTAIDTKLIGALKMRLSYNLQYERDAPVGMDSLDTISRATLVYNF